MKAKTTLTALCSALPLSLVATTGAYAADTHKVYSSGILVLAFIGFVALVVVVQMIPAILTVIGMIRSFVQERKTEAAKVSAR